MTETPDRTAQDDGALAVEQCDRDAAADFIAATAGDSIAEWETQGCIRKGELDDSVVVQHFAKHRTSNTPRTDDGLVEALAIAVGKCVEGEHFDPFHDPEAFEFASKIAAAVIAALSARAQSTHAPDRQTDDMVLVPREPTEAMIEAGHAEWLAIHKESGWPLSIQHKRVYKAMIAASTGDAS